MANTTFNPSDLVNITLSGGNLTATPGTGAAGVRTVHRALTGKFYFEAALSFTTAGTSGFGIANGAANLSTAYSTPTNVSYVYDNAGSSIYVNSGTAVGSLGVSLSSGNTVSVAVDISGRRIWYRLAPSGNWNGSAGNDPATGVGGFDISALVSGGLLAIYPVFLAGSSGTRPATANFGDTAFIGAVPSGFTAGFPAPGSPTLAYTTQAALEHWVNVNANAQLTSIFLEHWGPAGSSQPQAVATLVALEQWMTVAPPARGGPMVSMIW